MEFHKKWFSGNSQWTAQQELHYIDADFQSCLCYFLGEKLERGVLIFQYDVPRKYFPSE